MAASISLNIVQNSQNAATNKSNVTVSIVIKWDYGSYNLTNPPGTITIDGVKYNFNANYNSSQTSSGSQTLYSKTVDVSHDDEGKKTLACSATYDTEGVSGVVTASASKVLTQIARASSIGATDANIGSVSAISVSKKASAYTHSIAYKFGSLTGYVTSSGGVSSSEVKFSGSSIPFTVPTSFYAQIPSAKTGTVTLTCRTYSGSTLIGTDTCTFTVTAAQSACTPTVSGTVVDSNSATKALTGNEAKLVRYMSTALCTISASARNSASLTGKKINNVSVDASRSIANVETNSFNFYAVDSRGYATSMTMETEMIPYVELTCNISAVRTAPTTGEALITIKGNYYNGSFGASDNSLTVKYRINDGDYIAVTPSISGNTYSASVPLTGMDYQSSFEISTTVYDKLDFIYKSTTLGEGLPTYAFGKDWFKIFVDKVDGALPAKADSSFIGCYFRTSSSGSKEWINPPMEPDAEYQTIDRCAGIPVFTKVVSLGSLPNNTTKSVGIAVGNKRIVSIEVYADDGTNDFEKFPMISGGNIVAYWYAGNGSIVIRTLSNLTSFSAYAIIKYTETRWRD